jgi:serine/threonine protein kinase
MLVCPTCAVTYSSAEPCPRDGSTPQSAVDDPLLGTTIGSYAIAAKIGVGGMGSVYRGVHPEIQSLVAIKVLSHESACDAEVVRRFFEEARSVNLVRHQNIVNILDLAWLPDGRPYIVMEYLDGVSLKTIIRRNPLSVQEACRIAVALLDALAAAHDRAVLHRDVKPDNVILSSFGRVTLVDFGIAKISAVSASAPRTETGVILGTPHYMSPEQAQGRPVDVGTDIYAMGIVLYEMLTGTRPFRGDSIFEILRCHIEQAPRPPSQLVAMPAALEDIIMVSLSKDTQQRFRSARAMQNALLRVSPSATSALNNPSPSSARTVPPSVDNLASIQVTVPWVNATPYGIQTTVQPASELKALLTTQESTRSMMAAPKSKKNGTAVWVTVGICSVVAAIAVPLWSSSSRSQAMGASNDDVHYIELINEMNAAAMTGDFVGGVEAADKALVLRPNDMGLRVSAAMFACQAHRPDLAKKHYALIVDTRQRQSIESTCLALSNVELNPASKDSPLHKRQAAVDLYMRGTAALESKDFFKAAQLFDQSHDLNPDQTDYMAAWSAAFAACYSSNPTLIAKMWPRIPERMRDKVIEACTSTGVAVPK